MLSRPGALLDFNFFSLRRASACQLVYGLVCHALRLGCVKSTDSTIPQSTWPCALHLASGVVLLPLCRCLPWWWPVGAREGGASGDVVFV